MARSPRPFAVCGHFRREVEACLRQEALAGRFELKVFPASCRNGACKLARGPIPGGCFELIAPAWLLDNLIREGAYLVSPGWLDHWEEEVAAWGFGPGELKEFARESMERICLLDSLVLPESGKRLEEMAAALDRPALRIPLGLSHCAARLAALLEPEREARQGEAVPPRPSTAEGSGSGAAPSPARPPRPDADYAMALDLLAGLALFQSEAEVVSRILDISSMLFAPGGLRFLRCEPAGLAGVQRPFREEEAPGPEDRALCEAQAGAMAALDSGSGLVVPLRSGEELLGLLVLEDFALPERREFYRDLLEPIAPILALSLRNARNFEAVRRNEAALVARQVELLSMVKLRDRLFSIIGHDLRGPIGAMGDFLRFVIGDLKGAASEPQVTMLREVLQAAERASFLLGNLLEWGLSQQSLVRLRPASILLREEVEGVRDLLRGQAEAKGVGILDEVPPDFLLVADRPTLATVLRNLVSNAIKFTPPGGSVTLRARRLAEGSLVEVLDTGVGMDADQLAQARESAEPRSTAGTEGERGTGLGLLLCRDFMERNGGKLGIDSRPGQGTRVSLLFPDPPGSG
jgi:signal transduction histidine kinase